FSQQGVVTASAKISALVKSTKADGIFFTSDTAGALPLFSQLLTEQGVNPAAVQFMGLTRWDIPQSTLELPGVQNGWFALPDPSMTSRFVGRYQSTYGDAPHPIAGLAYDAIAAIGALLKQGTNTPFSNENLTQSAGFAGVNGAFRLRTDGTSQRALSVAQIQNNQVVIVAPAPKSFGLLK
ncbi:MAG: ABC transporter substrate-binding protein, partial [Halocynthiibacter sp.]